MPHNHDSTPACEHSFHTKTPHGERKTRIVVTITAVMMVVEIVAGRWFGSMALLADGWHMATHVAALGITAAAYWFARQHADDPRYAFGTWKIEVLGGFTSAVVLAIVAVLIAYESIERLWRPATIDYADALLVTALGLVVNVACAMVLQDGHHDHGHGHSQDQHFAPDSAATHNTTNDEPRGDPGASTACPRPPRHKHSHDLNLRAAYLHVVADAATSVLAIGALLCGKYLQWSMLDPLTGIVGAAVIGVWAVGLLRDSSNVLLDREMDHPVVAEIRATLEADGDAHVIDLHAWRIGRNHFACVAAVEARNPKSADEYRKLLTAHEEIVHATIEVRQK